MGHVDDNRRETKRHNVCFPIEINTGSQPRVGLSRNASVTGLLLGSDKSFEPGQALSLKFRVGTGEEHLTVGAKVVRTEVNNEAHIILWRHLAAVRFDNELGIAAALEKATAS